jgi:hypothetical protein
MKFSKKEMKKLAKKLNAKITNFDCSTRDMDDLWMPAVSERQLDAWGKIAQRWYEEQVPFECDVVSSMENEE